MKKILFYAFMAMATVLVSSCSSDDDGEESLSINKSQLEMYADNEALLTATTSAQWSSDNDFVAEVDQEGKVTANHVGETTITASNGNKRAYCKVSVVPQYTLYADPVLDFGCSMSDVKSKEKRTLAGSGTNYIGYKGDNDNVTGIIYNFNNGKLNGVIVMIKHNYNSAMADRMVNFLRERYAIAGYDDDVYYFVNGNSGSFDMAVYLDPTYSDNPRYATITYLPYERNSK